MTITREQIEQMQAGAEMDELIATKVMELPPQPIYVLDGYEHQYKPKHYSTDISAAWEVVKAMEKYSCDFQLEKSGASWTAIFGAWAIANADTAPLAICRAALLAYEGVTA